MDSTAFRQSTDWQLSGAKVNRAKLLGQIFCITSLIGQKVTASLRNNAVTPEACSAQCMACSAGKLGSIKPDEQLSCRDGDHWKRLPCSHETIVQCENAKFGEGKLLECPPTKTGEG